MDGPQAPPGWYQDPDDPRLERRWDGQGWTGRRRPGRPGDEDRHADEPTIEMEARPGPVNPPTGAAGFGDPPPEPTGPGPGWYPDPETPLTERWWDGRAWTEARRALAPEPLHRRPWFVVTMAVALLAIAGIAWFGSRSAPDAPSDTAVVASDTTAAATAETTTTTIAETTTEPVETTTTVAETTTSSAEETTTSTIEETTTSAAEPPEPVFGSGTFVVGDDVAPGVYETGDIGSGLFGGCSWERLDSDGEVIASHDAVGHAVVEIKDTDAAFDSDCDEWFELTPLDEPLAAIPDGTWVVGVHIFPDTYTTGGGRRCGFERLAGAGRDPADVLSSEEPDGETTVEILDTDYAFSTAGCDHWMS